MDPIRCFTCNKTIGNKWNHYRDLYQKMENDPNSNLTYDDIMKQLGIARYCCKRMFKTSVDVTEKILDYKQVHNTMKDNPYVTYKTTTVDKSIRTYSTN